MTNIIQDEAEALPYFYYVCLDKDDEAKKILLSISPYSLRLDKIFEAKNVLLMYKETLKQELHALTYPHHPSCRSAFLFYC